MSWKCYFNCEPAGLVVSGNAYHDTHPGTYPYTGAQHVEVEFPDSVPVGHGGYLNVTAPGYKTQLIRVNFHAPDIRQEDGSLLGVVMQPDAPALPLVGVSGINMVTNGQRWVYNGASHFLILLKMLLGQELIDYSGPNVYRVFGTMASVPAQAGLPPLNPDSFGRTQYLDAVRQSADWCANRGKYLDLCVLADLQTLGKDDAWGQGLMNDINAALQDKTNVLLCAGNEPWNGANGFHRDRLSRPPGPLPWSQASIMDDGGSEGWDGAHWDIIRVHTRRDFPKMLDHCALPTPVFQIGKPAIVDEPFKVCDPTHGGYFDPRLARVAGESGRAINGICFHCPGGVFSNPWSPQEAACADAFFNGTV